MKPVKEHFRIDPEHPLEVFYTPNVLSTDPEDLKASCDLLNQAPIGYTVYAEHIVTFLLGSKRLHAVMSPEELAAMLANNLKTLADTVIESPLSGSYMRMGNIIRLFDYRFAYLFCSYPEIAKKLYIEFLGHEFENPHLKEGVHALVYRRTIIECLGKYSRLEGCPERFINPESLIKPPNKHDTSNE